MGRIHPRMELRNAPGDHIIPREPIGLMSADRRQPSRHATSGSTGRRPLSSSSSRSRAPALSPGFTSRRPSYTTGHRARWAAGGSRTRRARRAASIERSPAKLPGRTPSTPRPREFESSTTGTGAQCTRRAATARTLASVSLRTQRAGVTAAAIAACNAAFPARRRADTQPARQRPRAGSAGGPLAGCLVAGIGSPSGPMRARSEWISIRRHQAVTLPDRASSSGQHARFETPTRPRTEVERVSRCQRSPRSPLRQRWY